MADIDTVSEMLTRAGIRFSRFPETLELENDLVLTFDRSGQLVRMGSDLTDAALDAISSEG